MSFFKSRRFLLSSLMVAMGLSMPLTPVWAQTFPSKPVRIVIGFPPGGGIDIVARTIAPKLSEALGQPVIIDNKPGVAGVLGTNLVAKAPADGHTIFFGTTGNISINPAFMPNLPFSMDKDFTPLMLVASLPFLVYAHPSVPVKNLSELVAYAKANPGKVNFYSSGNGGLPHLTGELLNNVAGIQTVHIAYKGSAPGMNDLIGGQVDFIFGTMPALLPQIKAGKLKALMVGQPRRSPAVSDVPTANEAGYPSVHVSGWTGIVAPANTSPAVVKRLSEEIQKILATPDIRETLSAAGAEPVGSTPEQFGEFIRAEIV